MMTSMVAGPQPSPRAVGRRIQFPELPRRVRSWVAGRFGPVDPVIEHRGGMSPGCATTLACADGGRIFIKAVGRPLNEQTTALFRSELTLLRQLNPAPYRPVLRNAYDDGEWIALVFDHVPGRYPDLSAADDFAAVARAVHTQIAELTPPPGTIDVPPLAVTAARWVERWQELAAAPHRFLPTWAADRFDELSPSVSALPRQVPATTLCHFDIRDDNLLIDPNGQAVVLDWGMARLGPSWTDLVLLAAQQPTPEQAQSWLERWVPPDAQETVTSMLVAFAGSQAWNANQPPRPSLPTFAAFAGGDADRLFAIARLRLGNSAADRG